ncbi:ABC transporter substrate-binding protein [Actinoplanes sp. DH11]|uniref:ABC transporter substrate-binding protein n=1 Tax=Actinoplanes sp. DH11 TaxID=2857011 RepID=UPI001E3A963C|nr:ABC transporter substrate-binding protein [Actinoplanes sp. DH11]
MIARVWGVCLAGLLAAGALGCGGGQSPPADDDGPVVVGFSQVGTESAWQVANTESIREAAAAAGVRLEVRDGMQKQEQQIADIRAFLGSGVDVIVLSPVVESGWDAVLQDAKDAGTPVILVDRTVDTTDTSLYVTALGSDFVAEGRTAGEWLVEQYREADGPVRIVEIEGTTGAASTNGRLKGFAEAVAVDPDLQVIASRDGGFTREQGARVMAGFLKKYDDIDVVFAHNDEEGLGAVDAIEAVRKRPGTDIKIITVDATRAGLTALAQGKLNYVVECNPLLGPQLMELVEQVAAGQTPPRRVLTTETAFDQESARAALPGRKY